MNIWHHDNELPWMYWLDEGLESDPDAIQMALGVLIDKAQLTDAGMPDDNEPSTFYGLINSVTVEVNRYSDVKATFDAYMAADEMPFLAFVPLDLRPTRLDSAPFTEGVLEVRPMEHRGGDNMEHTKLKEEAPFRCPACGHGIWGDNCPECGVIPSDYLMHQFWGMDLMSRYDVSAAARTRYVRDQFWERECWRGMTNVLLLMIKDLMAANGRMEFIAKHEQAFMVGLGEGAKPRSPQTMQWLGDLYDEVHAEPKPEGR